MDSYYSNQAGSGIATFSGTRFQKGSGFFSILKGALWPLLKKALPYIGKKALDTGINIATDIKSGTKVKEAMKRGLKRRLGDVAEDALVEIQSRTQKGEGLRRIKRRRVVKRKQRRVTKKRTKRRKTTKSCPTRANCKFLF